MELTLAFVLQRRIIVILRGEDARIQFLLLVALTSLSLLSVKTVFARVFPRLYQERGQGQMFVKLLETFLFLPVLDVLLCAHLDVVVHLHFLSFAYFVHLLDTEILVNALLHSAEEVGVVLEETFADGVIFFRALFIEQTIGLFLVGIVELNRSFEGILQ